MAPTYICCRLNHFKLCEDVCKLHDNFQGTGVIHQGSLVAMFAKPNTPIPEETKFQQMFVQTEIIAGMMKSNSDFFGSPRFFNLSFENCDLLFFPLAKYGQNGILAIQVFRPYVHEDIVSRVMTHLEGVPAQPEAK